nr:reverse transcriptase domain-containing protein [Tanacetum cinerariifolium]
MPAIFEWSGWAYFLDCYSTNELWTKNDMIQQVHNSCQFHGLMGDDANKHLDKFLHVTKRIKVNEVTDDTLRLYLFHHSLTHHATAWFDLLPRNSNNTFEQMAKMFLGKYFQPSMVTNLRSEITNFRQRLDESLFKAWERYKLSIDQCPNHNMFHVTQIDTFYNGLTLRHRDTINVAAGGTFMKRRPEECYNLIENMTAYHNDWDTSAQCTTVGNTQNVYAAGAYQGIKETIILRGTTKEGTNSSTKLAMVKTHLQLIKHQLIKHQLIKLQFMKMNTALSSGSETLPSNTITNPKEELKAITTSSGTAYQGPTIPTTSSSFPSIVERETEATKDPVHPTNNGSIKNVQPLIVQTKTPILNSKPVVAPIIEPIDASVSAPKPNQRPLISYPSRLHDQKLRDKANDQKEIFFQIFKDLNFNIIFVDSLILMPKFGPTIKTLLTNKNKLSELARTLLNEHCSAVLLKKLPKKLGDPGKFLISCDFLGMAECLALVDLDASINLMPLSVWNKLSLPDRSPTCMSLELVDRLNSRPVGVAEDVFVKVGTFHFLAKFVVVDFNADPRVPLVLRRYFIKTERALIDLFEGELTLRVGKEAITFNLDQTSRYSANYNDMTAKQIDIIDMACEDDFLLEEVDAFLALEDDPTLPKVDQFYELKIYEAKSDKSSIDEPLKVKLKDLPPHLEYAFLEGDDEFHVIYAKDLSDEEKTALITVLKPHKHDIAWKLSDIKGNEYYCFLDGFSGYFEIPIDPKDQEKTAFTCPYRTFAYRRTPFGLYNAPERMLKRCEDTNLCLNWEKSHFMVKEGIVLGHKISKNRIEVDKAKVEVITKLPHPTTVKGIHSFLGRASFYRQFIKDFSKIARPMTRLLEKDTPFFFSKECIEAFQTLKRKLVEALILIAPDRDFPFELMYDASDFAIESNYTTTDKEMLAVVYAFKKFRSCLIMNKSIVYTDHFALKYLFAKKDSKARMLRWVLLLQEFTLKVIDTKGAKNLTADHLSRLENPHQNVLDPKEINKSFPLETLNLVSSRVCKGHAEVRCQSTFSYRVSPQIIGQVEAFRTSYKTPIGCTPYKLVYGKACHLLIELEHKAYWALKHANFDLQTTGDHKKVQLNKLNELHDQAYENSLIYKEKTKRLHDLKIKDRVFNIGDRVLLFNSRLKIFSGKLKSRWFGPFTISHVFLYGTIELSQTDGPNFKVNGHRLKHYFGKDIPKLVVPDLQTFPKDQ